MDPQGRASKDRKRLEEMVELYVEMIEKNLSMPKAISLYCDTHDNLDNKTIQARINDLSDLLEPLP
jgi:hypothetical protein